MRRILLVLTFMSFAGWSQPALQQAQAPLPAQTQTPQAVPWVHLAELAVPGIVGIAGALIAVFLTNRYNAATNAANREHELAKLDREHSFALKRDALIRVTQSFVQTHVALRQWNSSLRYLERPEVNGEEEFGQTNDADAEATKEFEAYRLRQTELEQATAAACLAVSDDLWKAAESVVASIVKASKEVSTGVLPCTKNAQQIGEEIALFIKAARNELGIVTRRRLAPATDWRYTLTHD